MEHYSKTLDKEILLTEKTHFLPADENKWRLRHHLMPPVGWLNNPNGLCYANDYYHVFFQYAPFESSRSITLWGHYQSKNLIVWEYTGTPILPDLAEEKNGIYSGCTYVEDGIMHLYYTGDDGCVLYTTSTNGITISQKLCLLTSANFPSFVTSVRDPKVWMENGIYYMVLGAHSTDNAGLVLLFSSVNKITWNYLHAIQSERPFGCLWEFPDLFSINGQHVLSISLKGIEPKTFSHQNACQSGYFLLDGDFTSDYRLRTFREWDMGFDFYAPQTFEDEKGRHILIGFMGMTDCEEDYTNPTIDHGWQHALTIPRELTLSSQGTTLLQNPIQEMEELRETPLSIRHRELYGGFLAFELYLTKINSEYCEIALGQNLRFIYTPTDHVCRLFFQGKSGYGRRARYIRIPYLNSLRVLADTSAIEIYLNDGETVLTTRFYNEEEHLSVYYDCRFCSVSLWKLKSYAVSYPWKKQLIGEKLKFDI